MTNPSTSKQQRLRDTGALQQDTDASYYVYQLQSANHEQAGIVCGVSVAAYQDGHVRQHEHVRPQKAQDRSTLMTITAAQTGPVILSYPDDANLQAHIDHIMTAPPDIDVTQTDDDVIHRVWRIKDANNQSAIIERFDEQGALYIADGHHRCAAAAYTAETLGTPASQYFLAACFPASSLQILGYHRVVKDLNGLNLARFLRALPNNINVSKAKHAVLPRAPGEIGFYCEHAWYRLQLPTATLPYWMHND